MSHCLKHGPYSVFCRACDLDIIEEESKAKMTLSNQTYLYPNQESLISDQISNQFYLPYAIVKTHLENYYILHWQGSHILDQIEDSPDVYGSFTISREGIVYLVKFDEELLGVYMQAHLEQQYKLSFRRAKNDLYGTVLIRKIGN